MRKNLFMAVFILVIGSFTSLQAQWAKIISSNLNELPSSFQMTKDGGFIIVGYRYTSENPDVWDATIVKLNSDGDVEWMKTYDGGLDDVPYSVLQTSDGGYLVLGMTNSLSNDYDIFVLKFTSNGDMEWQRTYGGDSSDLCGPIVRQTNDGGYIFTGYTRSFIPGPYPPFDLWIIKTSSDGTIEWQKTYGGTNSEFGANIQQTKDGGYLVNGHTYSYGAGRQDNWILKLNSMGGIEWQFTYGGAEFENNCNIQQTDDGGMILGGTTSSFGTGKYDFWILKLFSNGTIEWQRTYGGPSYESMRFIQQTNDGGYIAGGNTDSFGSGGYDIWLIKLDSIGNIEWQRIYGGGGADYARSIIQNESGEYFIVGASTSFGTGDFDIWLLKLDENGEIDPSCGFINTSDAIVTETNVIPISTNVVPCDTNITPQEINISFQNTNAISNLLCSHPQTPEDQIRNLIKDIQKLVDDKELEENLAKPLIVKLNIALQSLEKENNQAVCNQLNAFIYQVNAYINSKKLAPDIGEKLIKKAEKVIYELCGVESF